MPAAGTLRRWQQRMQKPRRAGRAWGDFEKLAVGDGALGFWDAIAEIYPSTKAQRCWVHKTANVLDKLPKHKQPAAKEMIHQI